MADSKALLFGVESEYAMVQANGRAEPGKWNQALLDHFRKNVEWLPDQGNGIMTVGARIYEDCGHHLEIATAPATNPWDAVSRLRYYEALASAFCTTHDNEVWLTRCNHDYVENVSWGCHEGYSISNIDPRPILGHIVSRIIYCAGGGLTCTRGRVPRMTFCLSPRAPFIGAIAEPSRVSLWGFKSEPSLVSGKRLHLMSSGNLASDQGYGLMLGSTALLLKIMAAVGPSAFARIPVPITPLAALQNISSAWWVNRCRPVRTNTGWVEPLQLQRMYCELVGEHIHRLPPWAPWLIDLWSQVLNRLDTGPESSCSDAQMHQPNALGIEWLAKQSLYERCLQESGGYSLPDLATEKIPEDVRWKLLALEWEWGRLCDGLGDRWAQENAKLPFMPACDHQNPPLYPAGGTSKERSDIIRALANTEQRKRYACTWHSVTDKHTGEIIHRFREKPASSSVQVESIVANLEEYVAGGRQPR